MEWAQKRQIFYALLVASTVILLAAYPVYKAVNPAPTCSDGKQNGTEVGIDCGGACVLFCPSQVKEPHVVWAKAFLVAPGRYDVGAYIENSNISAGLKAAPYTLRVLDASGQVLTEQTSTIEIPPASAVLVFGGDLPLATPPDQVQVVFDAGVNNTWLKARVADSLVFTKNQTLRNTETKPRFDATLVNNDLVNEVGKTVLGAIIYDGARHPVAISRTYIDGIPKGGEQDVFFTWPNRFTKNPRGAMCTTPVDTMLVFDRSGSMDQGRRNPPEPLTAAKNAANAYVDAADLADKVGLVSFANTASNPIDQELSLNHDVVHAKVSEVAIEKGSLQNTNFGEALRVAVEELSSVRHTKDAKRVIVALTDGVANRPFDPVNPKNTTYAETYAMDQAMLARGKGIEVYVVGLGKDINESFLRDRIATDANHYFNAPTAESLQDVYRAISETVCKPENFLTELVITPRAVFEGQ